MNVRSVIALVAGLGLALAACGGGDDSRDGGGGRGGAVDLTGAGATFPYPIYLRWFSDYDRQHGIRINYGSLGSGAGIRQLSEQTVDFGASDSPMSDKELAAAKGGPVVHVPTVVGAVVVAYNLPSLSQPLRLSGEVIAELFLGRITRWDDVRIAADNPGVALPAEEVLVVHRTDAAGTTYIFTDYLTTVSPAWANGPGRGKQVKWPTGLVAKGNEGVAAQVKLMEGAVGYTELYAKKLNELCALDVVEAKEGDVIVPGRVFLAPAGTAILVIRRYGSNLFRIRPQIPRFRTSAQAGWA